MKRRRLAALHTLKRLKKYEMEINARELGGLRLQKTKLTHQKQSLIKDIEQQPHSLNADMTPYMQQYMPAAKSEIRTLDRNITKLEPHISALEEQISQQFKEFKTYDIMHGTLNNQMREDKEAQEVATIEEVLLSRWSIKL